MFRFLILLAFIITLSSCAGIENSDLKGKINANFHEICKRHGFKYGASDYLNCITEQKVEFKKSQSAARLEKERKKNEELRREREIIKLKRFH
ncbi:MAG: hypothetical protein KAJ75_00800 [Alphaproteobacteria bacterium]|nr:hypothetical protein [Alphaproteobacteria bacterium]